jgi:hypothetical protein
MNWGAQNRSKDAKTPSAGLAMSKNPEPGLWPVQPYSFSITNRAAGARPKVLRGRHFAVLAGLKNANHTQKIQTTSEAIKNSANPFPTAVFFLPTLLTCPPGRYIFLWRAYCSAVSKSLLFTPAVASTAGSWLPNPYASGSAAGWREGIWWVWVGPRHKILSTFTCPHTCAGLMSDTNMRHTPTRQQARSACTPAHATAAQRCSTQLERPPTRMYAPPVTQALLREHFAWAGVSI